MFEVEGDVVKLRQPILASFGGVMSLDADPARWRAMFPHPTSLAKFDLAAAVGFLMQQCRVAQRRADADRAAAGDRTSGPSGAAT